MIAGAGDAPLCTRRLLSASLSDLPRHCDGAPGSNALTEASMEGAMVWLRTLASIVVAAISFQLAHAESVLVEFTTQNCGPCQRMRPIVQQLASEGYAVRE